jgi:hypothetical protein
MGKQQSHQRLLLCFMLGRMLSLVAVAQSTDTTDTTTTSNFGYLELAILLLLVSCVATMFYTEFCRTKRHLFADPTTTTATTLQDEDCDKTETSEESDADFDFCPESPPAL